MFISCSKAYKDTFERKTKNYIKKMKFELKDHLSKCKNKGEEKKVRDIYKSKTRRDLKHDRDIWGSDITETCEINLISDAMIDKITSLYGLVIKNNQDLPILDIKNALVGIVKHLSANELNCQEMHEFCTKGEFSWCHYQKAIALGQMPPKHPSYLSEECRNRC